MLYYGNSSIIPILKDGTSVYNITSYREGLQTLNLLPPFDRRLYTNDCRDFDIEYAKWIFDYDVPFYDFFRIVFDLYSGYDVCLIMTDDDWSENIIESLLKLIQQRYGYNGCRIYDLDSYIYAQNNITSGFEGFGLASFDFDRDRFSRLALSINPNLIKIGEDQC